MLEDIYNLHHINLPENYEVNLFAHLENHRDNEHFITTMKYALEDKATTILDIGSWDGWLPLLLARNFKNMHISSCEWVLSLLNAGERYAKKHDLKNYYAYHGNWLDIEISTTEKWDLITCYEVIEHIPFEKVKEFIQKIEKHAKRIIISLPDQKKEDNKQHQWTPTKEIIDSLFKEKKDVKITYKRYFSSKIQPNWFITYSI